MIDLDFPVLGSHFPSDHGYVLYGALSRLVPKLHDGASSIRIASIRGAYAGNGLLQLDDFSLLRFRLPAEEIPLLLPLAGKALEVDGHRIRLGVPQVRALVPASRLHARLVIIKASSPCATPSDKGSRNREQTRRYLEPAEFLQGAGKQLADLGITEAQASIPLVRAGPHEGKPRRLVLRVRDKVIIGFPLLVDGLKAEESIWLQETGIGGRGRMGASFFLPAKGEPG